MQPVPMHSTSHRNGSTAAYVMANSLAQRRIQFVCLRHWWRRADDVYVALGREKWKLSLLKPKVHKLCHCSANIGGVRGAKREARRQH